MLADKFGALACHFLQSVRQDNYEFIAAITAGDFPPAEMSQQQAFQLTQNGIAGGISLCDGSRKCSFSCFALMGSRISFR